MNLVDLLVLAIVGISALLGLSRGLVRELLGLGSWVVAGLGAYRFGPAARPMLEQAIGNPDIADPAAYAIVFVLLLVVLSLLSNLIGRAVELSALGGLDRSLGLVFGVLRAAVVLILAYIPLSNVFPPERWPPQLQQARTVPWIASGAKWTVARFPRHQDEPARATGRQTHDSGLVDACHPGGARAWSAGDPHQLAV